MDGTSCPERVSAPLWPLAPSQAVSLPIQISDVLVAWEGEAEQDDVRAARGGASGIGGKSRVRVSIRMTGLRFRSSVPTPRKDINIRLFGVGHDDSDSDDYDNSEEYTAFKLDPD